jgi:Flp pilus assembly protein TadG
MSARLRDDAGAAVVDFVLISLLLVLMLMGVLQTAAYFYTRNLAAASAADGARYAAALGVAPGAAGPRAEQLLRAGLPDGVAAAIHCTGAAGTDAASGLTTITVHCTGRLRLLFLPLRLPLTIDVTSSALQERRP